MPGRANHRPKCVLRLQERRIQTENETHAPNPAPPSDPDRFVWLEKSVSPRNSTPTKAPSQTDAQGTIHFGGGAFSARGSIARPV